jgi:hypothetical protein
MAPLYHFTTLHALKPTILSVIIGPLDIVTKKVAVGADFVCLY